MAYKPSVRDLAPRDDLALLTCAEMARADAAAIAAGVPGIDLMEAAGRAVADAVYGAPATAAGPRAVRPRQQRRRRLRGGAASAGAGWPVRLGPARRAWRAEGRCRLGGGGLGRRGACALSLGLLDGRPLVIDALFGAGLTRPIEGIAGELIDRINDEALTRVAVDVPSGLHGDSGESHGPRADRRAHGDVLPRQARALFARRTAALRRARRRRHRHRRRRC